jgi:diamine N-acetyltransferase
VVDTSIAPAIHFARITARTVRAVCRLSETLTPQQRKMVVDNAVSIAQAHCSESAWMYDDEIELVLRWS